MSKSDNIEERLVPYVEGVLNEAEHAEVERALEADGALAREVEELKEVIGDLRKAFASGVSPEFPELSPEEIVELASHDGQLETMTGTAEQKSRLFCNDQALHEYRLLRSLSQDMQQTTLPMVEEIPPMPESMLAEIGRYKSSELPGSKVVELAPRLRTDKAAKGGFFGFLDRLDPKPLMATAAALVLFSMGFHAYNNRSPLSGGEQVSYSYTEPSATPTAPSSPVTEVATKYGNSVVEPTGVTVFTSGDRELLKQQAEKLLAEKVRYTVTEDRILVSEDELAEARSVLWGEDEAATVAVAEERPVNQLRRAAPSRVPPGKDKRGSVLPPKRKATPLERYQPPPLTRYDYRTSDKKRDVADDAPPVPVDEKPALGEGSALKTSGPDEVEPRWNKPDSANQALEESSSEELETGSTRSSVTPGATGLKGASKEEREKILRSMALGQTEPRADDSALKAEPEVPQSDLEQATSKEIRITRGRVEQPEVRSMPSPVQEMPAPVPNVVTSSRAEEGDWELELPSEDSGGAVATTAGSREKNEVPGYSVETRAAKSEKNQAPGRSATSPNEPETGVLSQGSEDEDKITEKGDVDLRLAVVRGSQATVARRYNVVLSIEQVGEVINVYVRPEEEMSKAELDELRKAIRADLGLSDSDAIIFR